MLELRSFQQVDADAVWALHNEALEHAGAHGGHGPWENDLRDIQASYLDAGGAFVVALVDGELVGMGGLQRVSAEECELRRMRVRPSFQRRGLGRALLAELEDRARALGFETARLDTTETQEAARRLYESSGYEELGRRDEGRFVLIDFAKALRLAGSTGREPD